MNSNEFNESVSRVAEQGTYQIIENSWNRVFHGLSDYEVELHNFDVEVDDLWEESFELMEVVTKETREGTKYKVRVKDRQSGSSYVRFATREKIAELRANPNISSVEITAHDASAGNADGTDATRQDFSGSANSNNSTYKAKLAQRAQKERYNNKKAFSLGKLS